MNLQKLARNLCGESNQHHRYNRKTYQFVRVCLLHSLWHYRHHSTESMSSGSDNGSLLDLSNDKHPFLVEKHLHRAGYPHIRLLRYNQKSLVRNANPKNFTIRARPCAFNSQPRVREKKITVFTIYTVDSLVPYLVEYMIVSLGIVDCDQPGSFQEICSYGCTTYSTSCIKLKLHKLSKP